MTALAALAGEINRKLKGYRAGAIYFWDQVPTRPDDNVFIVQSAAVVGDHLELSLTDEASGNAAPTVISLWDADGSSPDPEGFSIQSASRVRWEDIDILANPKVKDPALRMRRAMV
jgi:hypothetical protein